MEAVKSAVDFSDFPRLDRMLAGSGSSLPSPFPLDTPFLLCHGDHDPVSDVQHLRDGLEYHRRLRRAGGSGQGPVCRHRGLYHRGDADPLGCPLLVLHAHRLGPFGGLVVYHRVSPVPVEGALFRHRHHRHLPGPEGYFRGLEFCGSFPGTGNFPHQISTPRLPAADV